MNERDTYYEVPHELTELKNQEIGILSIDCDREDISVFYDSALPDDLLDVLKESIKTNYYEMHFYPAHEEENGIYFD